MPTMDTMDTHMPTVDTTMARGPLMPSPLLLLSPRLMLMLSTDTDTDLPTMDMDMDLPTMDMDMPTMDTMDTHMPTMDTMARGPLMPSPLLMLPMLTMDMDTTDMDMLTMDTMDTHMPTVDTSMVRQYHHLFICSELRIQLCEVGNS